MATYDEYKSPSDTLPREPPRRVPVRGGGTYDEYGSQPTQAAPAPQEPSLLQKAGEAASNVGQAVVNAPGVSHLIRLSNALSERGSRAAGGVLRDFSQGGPVAGLANLPVAIEEGLVENKGPLLPEQRKAIGLEWQSPIPEPIQPAMPGFGTVGAMAQGAARFLTSPTAFDIGAETIATLPVDVATGGVLKGASAVSKLPRVAGALDKVREATAPVGNLLARGYAIPNTMREGVKEIVRKARGRENLLYDEYSQYLDAARDATLRGAAAHGMTPEAAEMALRDVAELSRDPRVQARATPEEIEAAMELSRLRASMPFDREAVGLTPRELVVEQVGTMPSGKMSPTPRVNPFSTYTTDDLLERFGQVVSFGGVKQFTKGLGENFAQIGEELIARKIDPSDLQRAIRGMGISDDEAAKNLAALVRESRPYMSSRSLPGMVEEMIPKFSPDFTPRVFTEEGRKVLGKDVPHRDYSSLGTPTPGVRTDAARRMSTRKLEELYQQGVDARGPIKKPLEPLLHAYDIRAKQTARSVANATALSDIAKNFSVGASKAGKGYVAMDKLDLTGFTAAAKKQFEGRYVHPEVYRYLDEFVRGTQPKQLPILNSFLKVWKPLVTSVNPQFLSRNAQWNAVISWIRGNRSPANWTDGAKVLRREPGQIKGFQSSDALRRELLENSIIGSGSMAEFGKSGFRLGKENVAKRIAGAGQQANTMMEDWARASFYIAMRRKGMSSKDAAKRTIQTFFDYSRDASSPFINTLRDTGIPFVVWTRNILPLTFRTLAENPSAFAGFGSISRNTAREAGLPEGEQGYLGQEFKQVPAFISKSKPGDKEGTFRASPLTQVGFYDLSDLTTNPKRWAMRQLSPAISVPLEAGGVIKNAFMDKDADDIVELPPAAGLFHRANPIAAEKLGIRMAAETGAVDRYVGPQWLNTILRLGGPLGTTVFDVFSDDQDARMRVLAYLSGVREKRNLSPEKGRQIQRVLDYVNVKEDTKKEGRTQRLIRRIQEEEGDAD